MEKFISMYLGTLWVVDVIIQIHAISFKEIQKYFNQYKTKQKKSLECVESQDDYFEENLIKSIKFNVQSSNWI